MPFVRKNEKKKNVHIQLDARRIFIGREQELYFLRRHILKLDVPDYNIVSFYGQGGIGKSTLLNHIEREIHTNSRYKDLCLIARINERQMNPASVMESFADQLDLKGEFEKALGHYKEALRKLYDEREQEQENFGRNATIAIASSAAKSIPVPVVNDLLSQGAKQVSGLVWDEVIYRQRLKDARHLENPLQDLTDKFIIELNKLVERQVSGSKPVQRVLLCFDTFEHLTNEIAPWLLDYFLPEEINENIVIIVAGRHALSSSTPNDPKRWLEYFDENVLHEIELKTFSKEETTLYLEKRGITEETKVNQIWQLSHGLPLYLGMLTAKQNGELDPMVGVVQNFLRWIPSEEVKRRLVLDASLFSRPFNRDELKALTYITEELREELYIWLLSQPFVRNEGPNGFHSYHEVAQEMFSRYLYSSSPEDCRETRKLLALHYQKALNIIEKSEGESAFEEQEWLDLALALIVQLFLLLGEEELVHALELTVQAIGSKLEIKHKELISKVLQMLQNELRLQMSQRARKIVESLIFYQESDSDNPKWYETISELLKSSPTSLKYSIKTRVIFLLRRANGYYEQKDYKKALLDLDKILELDSQNVLALSRKGNALDGLKRYEEALAAYDQAIQLDSTFVYAYNGKGTALYALERYEEALVAYDQAIQLDSTFVYAHNNKGFTLNNLKRYEEALAAYDQAIQLDPNYAYAYNNKSASLKNLKRYEEALAVSEQAIRIDPVNHNFFIQKILALYGLVQHCKELLTAAEYLISLDPSNSVVYYDRSAKRNELRRYEEALTEAQRSLTLDPSDLIYLVRGKDHGRNAWHYVLIDQVKLSEFLFVTEGGSIDVANYGKVLYSGWGKDPPPDIDENIDKQYSNVSS